MDADDHSSYRVPTGRPYHLKEFHDRLPGIDDRIRYLPTPADPTEYEDVADSLYDLFVTARNLAPPRNVTGCSRHPNGPIDPEAPDGWGRCLLCNRNRRIGRPRIKAGTIRQQGLYFIPPPPYNHAALLAAMKSLTEAANDLGYRAADNVFDHAADLTHGAFVIARELSRPRSTSKCRKHPGAPVDPAAPDGPRCMFCRADDVRRQRAAPPPVVIRPSRPMPNPLLRRFPRTPPAAQPTDSASPPTY